MKSLVVGMGIGQLYQSVLKDLGHTVITCDSNSAADFKNYDDALQEHKFDTVHICTPNFTHYEIAEAAAQANTKIIFVEKPGFANAQFWQNLVKQCPGSRFSMVKNNQYRESIAHFRDLAAKSHTVKITWNNNNRIPKPGSWFTNKDLSFGGVSRDLIPHLLSYYCALVDYSQGIKLFAFASQRWLLEDIDTSDYGIVDKNGVYNVDDFCEFEFKNNNTKYILTANWRSLKENDISISFDMPHSAVRHELGLCPEYAYKLMIQTAVENIDNDQFWKEQLAQDLWIHRQLERL
jgi:predicted dehydrogenase